jgi:hypothetical protein
MGHLYHGYVSHNLESSPGPPGPNSPTEWSPQANSKNLIRLLWKHGGFCVVVGARTGVQPTNMDFIYQEWLNCGFEWIDLIKDFKGKSKGNLGFSLQPIPNESLANGIGIICHVCPNKHNLVENPYSNWKSVTGYLMDDFPMPTASNLLSPSLPDFVNSETPFCQLVTSSEPAIIYKYAHVCLTCIYIYMLCVYIYAAYIYIYVCCVYAVYIYINMRVLCMLYIYIYTDIYSIYISLSLSPITYVMNMFCISKGVKVSEVLPPCGMGFQGQHHAGG